MQKVRIKIGIIGYLPFPFNQKKIKNWKSDIFEIIEISQYNINTQQSDTGCWEYSDRILDKELPQRKEEDIFIGITYIPIEDNYYSRRLKNNRLIVSYFNLHQTITQSNLPIENLLLRVLYAASLVFIIEKDIPACGEKRVDLIHDDTRGCIFDMNGIRSDVMYSLNKPQLCAGCIEALRKKKISEEMICQINKELKQIKADRYRRIESFIKKRPLVSLLITFLFGILMSMIANYLYDNLVNNNMPQKNYHEANGTDNNNLEQSDSSNINKLSIQ